ncbi:MAG: nodulation protein NfeD [Candidatus Promineifilaceae bacterium]
MKNKTRFTKVILLALAAAAFLFTTRNGRAQSPEVIVLNIDAPVTPAMLGYFERGILNAIESNAEAVVIVLDTPGGAVTTTTDIVQLFRNTSVPVIVYIGPAGAQAASAGSLITAAGHLSAMAPETVIGAASPINSDGSDINETAYRKAVEDLKATMRNLTERRGETAVALGEAMIEEARAVTAKEALEAGFIDFIATDVNDLLAQANGKTVTINDQTIILQTANAATRALPLNSVELILLALTNPLILGILLAIGAQAILIELSSPGGYVAGIIGVICIALALYGAGQLPVNWLGMGLIILAFVLFIMEAFAPTHGGLTIGGTVSLIAGLLVLFNSPGTPQFARISISGAIGIGLSTAVIFGFIIVKAIGAQSKQPATGAEGLIGKKGVVRRGFTSAKGLPPYTGTVLVNGELWRALAESEFAPGDVVVVTAVNGFTLHVQTPNT